MHINYFLFPTLMASVSAAPSERHFKHDKVQKRANTQQDYLNYAATVIGVLNTTYKTSDGLWGEQWWNSANVLTTLADFIAVDPTSALAKSTAASFENTFKLAPGYGPSPNFENSFNDDTLWWVLAWIRAHDVTGVEAYLTTAALAFDSTTTGWDGTATGWGKTPCGGLYWSSSYSSSPGATAVPTGCNAIENVLYLQAAALLANKLPNVSPTGAATGGFKYFNQAMNAYNWFYNGTGSAFFTSSDLLYDNLIISSDPKTNCTGNKASAMLTYNQGPIISGLSELGRATGEANTQPYHEKAIAIANATITFYTNDTSNIFKERCEPKCAANEQQFKGIFMRNLQYLVNNAEYLPEADKDSFTKFLLDNADSIMRIYPNGDIREDWDAAITDTSSVATLSSGLDAIVAAAAVVSS